MERKEVTLNKPRFIGSTIPAVSKTLLYDFHYNYMMENFEGCIVLFTDTDSFCYCIPGERDVYAKMRGNEWFDFSKFSKDNPNYDMTNMMVPGNFKDESQNETILEFAG